MLKLLNNTLNKVSSALYKSSVKVYGLEEKVARKRINQLYDEILNMQLKIGENRNIISDL